MTNKWERLSRIKSRSIFSLIADGETYRLAEASEFCTFGAGEAIRRETEPAFLYVVVEGTVLVRSAQNESSSQEKVTAGRSLELLTLISVQDRWRYDWVAETEVLLLKLPFVELERA